MRIDRYELANFGSHRATVYEPGDARLCIIQGANGLGKTTLVSEALGYALFRDFRGSVNGPVRIGATDSAVAIEFALGAERYRAIRRRTTKGAGKSSADLQIRAVDGTWSPVTSGDKEVPAEIAALLHMDANTFRTSVSLAQSDLRRFVDATAAGRKEVLASIVVDPRFAPAAAIAARRARDVEVTVAGDRSRQERLVDAIAELEPTVEVLARCRDELAAAERAIAAAGSARNDATSRIRELDVALAQADAIAAEVVRLEADRAALGVDWRSATDRRGVAAANRILAENTVATAADVDAAIDELPSVAAEVERLTADEAADRKLAAEITAAAAALEDIDRPLREAITTWRTKRGIEEARIRGLEEHARAGTSTCATCGQPIEEGQALEQLRAARARLKELGDEPKAPLALARASAAVQRLETRRRELGWDPAAMIAARDRLTALTAKAARGDAIAAARATLERESQAIVEADAEIRRIEVRGQAIRTRLGELAEQAASAEPLRDERSAQARALGAAEAALQAAQDGARAAERSIAQTEANVARLEALRAEQAELAGQLAATEVLLERLRYLAGRFGLKGIPARVIEGVLPELTRYANDALSALFGLQLDIRATRSSADGKTMIEALELVVCKEGTGEVELARASGGQGTAIALAMALGLARLNSRRAGTAIKTWIVDEPEGLDVVRLKALGGYLRDLVHRGELDRVFVITHTTELAEFGDRVDEVLEGPDGVELRQVA